jgi:hypothetical protein
LAAGCPALSFSASEKLDRDFFVKVLWPRDVQLSDRMRDEEYAKGYARKALSERAYGSVGE